MSKLKARKQKSQRAPRTKKIGPAWGWIFHNAMTARFMAYLDQFLSDPGDSRAPDLARAALQYVGFRRWSLGSLLCRHKLKVHVKIYKGQKHDIYVYFF